MKISKIIVPKGEKPKNCIGCKLNPYNYQNMSFCIIAGETPNGLHSVPVNCLIEEEQEITKSDIREPHNCVTCGLFINSECMLSDECSGCIEFSAWIPIISDDLKVCDRNLCGNTPKMCNDCNCVDFYTPSNAIIDFSNKKFEEGAKWALSLLNQKIKEGEK